MRTRSRTTLWQRALADEGMFLRRAMLVQILLHLAFGLAGLIANPDFSTGAEVSAVQVLGVDWNGWHAVSGFLLFGPGLVAVRRTDWTLWYTLAVVVVGIAPVPWMLLDSTPLGLLAFPNTESDAIYHVISSLVFVATIAVHLVLVRRKQSQSHVASPLS